MPTSQCDVLETSDAQKAMNDSLDKAPGAAFEQLIDGFLGHRSVCSVSESHKKPHRSQNAVFLYVPTVTCKSFRDLAALIRTE